MKNKKKSDEKNCDINLENLWSCGMKKCVDSSPLLVVQYHAESDDQQLDSKPSTEIAGLRQREKNNNFNGNNENDIIYVEKNIGITENDRDLTIKSEMIINSDLQQTSRLFIGSHGGDFSAIDAVSGMFIRMYLHMYIYLWAYSYLYLYVYMHVLYMFRYLQTSRLFIGSHGGDFSAIDAVTGTTFICIFYIYLIHIICYIYIHLFLYMYIYLYMGIFTC
jgi:hypothetical protein